MLEIGQVVKKGELSSEMLQDVEVENTFAGREGMRIDTVQAIRGLIVIEEHFQAAEVLQHIKEWDDDISGLIAQDRPEMTAERLLARLFKKEAVEKIGWLKKHVEANGRSKRSIGSLWSEAWSSITGLATKADLQHQQDLDRVIRERISQVMKSQQAEQELFMKVVNNITQQEESMGVRVA